MPRFMIAPCVAAAVLLSAVTATASERPAVRGFSISPARFHAVSAGARGGTKLHFRLSKPATVRIYIARHRGRHYHHVGTLVLRHQRAGRHTRRFRGRIGRHRLKVGRYRARLVAVDGHHRHSRRRTEYFRITRAASSPRPGRSPTPTPPRPSPTPPPSPPPGNGVWPNESNTGVPAGWQPAQTISRDMEVNQAGAVIQDIRFINGASISIDAPNVTVRRVDLQGGTIDTSDANVLIEDTTIEPGSSPPNDGEGVISYCGYTALRVKIIDRNEGFREGCNAGSPTVIQDSFARIVPPSQCPDWHGDGVQGYHGSNLVVNYLTIDFHESRSCQGTSPFFYVGGSGGSPNGHAAINGLLLKGGGYSFRMGTPGSVQGLKIVNNSWRFGPISITDAGCGVISPWEAKIVNVNAAWQPTSTVRNLSCRNDN